MGLSRMRFKSQSLAITFIACAAIAGCGSSTTDPASTGTGSSAPSSATAHIEGCLVKAPGPSDVDAAFGYMPGFSVEQICPADVDPSLPAKSAEFLATNAGKVLQNGNPAVAVFAGQLKEGDGDAFVHAFLTDLSAQTEAKDVGGYAVTYFDASTDNRGYVYSKGPTVVIAHDLTGDENVAGQALATVLANLFTGT
jgi:hypothetical protein